MNQKRSREWIPRQEADRKVIIPARYVTINPESYFNRLKQSTIDVLLYLYNNGKHMDKMYMTQEYIAKKLGYSRCTINQALGILHEDGLIYSHYRHLKSNTYRMSDWLKIKAVRKGLAAIMPRIFSFLLLLSPSHKATAAPIKHVSTQLNKMKSIKNIKRDILSIERVTEGQVLPPYKPIVWPEGLREEMMRRIKAGERMNGLNENWVKPKEQPQKQEEEGFDLSSSNPITVAIRNIQNIKLTKWGQIKVAAFSPHAILYADKQMKSITKASDHFKEFFCFCLEYSNSNKIEIKFGVSESLAKKYNMPQEKTQFYIPEAFPAMKERLPVVENYKTAKDRSTEEFVQQANMFFDWKESEAGKKFDLLFGSDTVTRPFWLHEIRPTKE